MKSKSLGILLSSAILFTASICTTAAELPTSSFIKGADISILHDVESHGGKFYNAQKEQQDPLVILKNNGFNWVRLRLWNEPKDSQGQPYGGGNNSLAVDLKLAKRAKALGFHLLLDFHYSDFWTDPGKQFKPKAWQQLNNAQLIKTIESYTQQTVAQFVAQGTTPDMIQIGNEINSGILWPTGKSWGQDGHEFDRLAALLKAAVKGAKASAGNALIMFHLAKGGDQNMYKWWFGEITKRNVPFDVIGLSYYPYWDGSMAALKANLDYVSEQFHKDVIVVETQYGYSTQNCDSAPNSFTYKEAKQVGYPATVAGQKHYIEDLIHTVASVNNHRGAGIFYWAPLWIAAKGATWATPAGMAYINDKWQEGNSRENQALFDCQGHVLNSIKAFN
ncbi:arabinogalactan endo-beta-1,4-galactanase [Celerinatantimonas sp. MCCC 1A17872]|uniref:glycoside hydrolase family 53 protein n=1 Tax=Celerinatantimonas sp. MCCC 1A17872 TaxID=3177514 RepID=UPI0038CBF51B